MRRWPLFVLATGFSACASTSPGPADGGSVPLDARPAEDAAPPAEDAAPGPAPDASALPDAQPGGGDAEPSDAAAAGEDAAVSVPDAGPRNPLIGAGTAELVASGFVFLEGPVWRPSEGVLLFSDLRANTIFALTPPASVAPFRMPSAKANGLANDATGLLLAAEHVNRRVSRTLASGEIVSVAERYQNARLSSPNDLAVARDGTIYFSDPPWGLEGRAREVDFNGVFRVAPDGTLTAEWEAPLDVYPNGVALSPDGERLYVADDQHAEVLVFDVVPGGALTNRRRFVTTNPVPDGMAIDVDGNLYVSTSAGVEVFSPAGQRYGALPIPMQPANCAFGGPARTTLYVTARTSLYKVELTIPGGE